MIFSSNNSTYFSSKYLCYLFRASRGFFCCFFSFILNINCFFFSLNTFYWFLLSLFLSFDESLYDIFFLILSDIIFSTDKLWDEVLEKMLISLLNTELERLWYILLWDRIELSNLDIEIYGKVQFGIVYRFNFFTS